LHFKLNKRKGKGKLQLQIARIGIPLGLAEWSERCASTPKITGSNPSGGSVFTFRSDLLLTARGCST
jgi:hypothetical protein